MQVSFTVNGQMHSLDVEPRALLANVLRDELALTGTHVGCDTTQCGCCTVHVNGSAVKSCTLLAVQAQGCEVVTIEGLGVNGLHPVQQAFSQCHALQCGFCTPGMIMASVDLLRHSPNASRAEIEEGLSGNLCRCTGYINIVKAVEQARDQLHGIQP